jgi:predicted nucleic acid-binding protein
MGKQRYLIDTNVVIDYLGNKLPATGKSFMNEVINIVPQVSVISKIELLGFNASEEHSLILSNFINDALVLGLTNNVVDNCIEIRKKTKTKLPDAIIAATAITHGLSLITRNTNDFLRLKGLKLINPHII